MAAMGAVGLGVYEANPGAYMTLLSSLHIQTGQLIINST